MVNDVFRKYLKKSLVFYNVDVNMCFKISA
jgi:hypothetical protein